MAWLGRSWTKASWFRASWFNPAADNYQRFTVRLNTGETISAVSHAGMLAIATVVSSMLTPASINTALSSLTTARQKGSAFAIVDAADVVQVGEILRLNVTGAVSAGTSRVAVSAGRLDVVAQLRAASLNLAHSTQTILLPATVDRYY